MSASDSATFDKLRPRANRGELVPRQQSRQKRPYALPDVVNYLLLLAVSPLRFAIKPLAFRNLRWFQG
jgi:hypothetical protein